MPLGQPILQNHLLFLAAELQQTQFVCQSGLCFSQSFRSFLLGNIPLGDQILDCDGFLKKIQVSSLYVFDQSENRRLPFICIHYNCRDFGQPCQLGSS